MTLENEVIALARKRYEIPSEVSDEAIVVSEDIEYDYSYSYGCSCCAPEPSAYVETTFWYQYVPVGKKRKITRQHTYTGTVYEFLRDETMS